jgi:hypothetical protein
LFEDAGFPFSPDGSLFGPSGSDIDGVDGVGEGSGQRIPAMGDGIGLDESRTGFVPLVGLDGDLVSQEGSWLGGAPSSFLILDSNGIELPPLSEADVWLHRIMSQRSLFKHLQGYF